jgi:hypothetical protein
VTLEHKIPEGGNYTAETTGRVEQKLTIAGTEVDTSSDTRSTSKFEVGTRDGEGNVRVKEKVVSLNISTTVMGQNYTFDSANPDNKGASPLEAFRDVHKAIARRTTTTVFDKSNRAVAVEMDEDITGSIPAELRALMKGQLDPQALKTLVNDELDQVKSDAIKKGDTWQRVRSTNFGAGQVMDFKTEFTYDGTIEKDGRELDKITAKTLSVTFALDNSPLPFSLKSSDLKPAESETTLLFDRKQGAIVESVSKERVTGDIMFNLNNQDLPAKLDLKLERSIVLKP